MLRAGRRWHAAAALHTLAEAREALLRAGGADAARLGTTWRAVARRHHPDAPGGCKVRFVELRALYERLRTRSHTPFEERRRRAHAPPPATRWSPGAGERWGASSVTDRRRRGTLGDLEAVFEEAVKAGEVMRGVDAIERAGLAPAEYQAAWDALLLACVPDREAALVVIDQMAQRRMQPALEVCNQVFRYYDTFG